MNKTFELEVISNKDNKKRSLAILSINGEEIYFTRHKSHVTYKVLDGSMVIETEEDYFPLTKGQMKSFDPFTFYRKIGDATIAALDTPPFDPTSLDTLK